jgi:hypothetical protein
MFILEILKLSDGTHRIVQEGVLVAVGKEYQVSGFEFMVRFAYAQNGASRHDKVKAGKTLCQRKEESPWSCEIGSAVRQA